jgi:hypothetical protein
MRLPFSKVFNRPGFRKVLVPFTAGLLFIAIFAFSTVA